MQDILTRLHERYGREIDEALLKYLSIDASPEFLDAVKYQVATGGKRIRPLMTMEAAKACGGDPFKALPYAAIVELIHNYSLIYDDIIDRGDLRRGLPTVRRKYGDNAAILIGIWYREAIEEAVLETRDPAEVARATAKAIKAIDEGERLDILMEHSGRTDPYFVDHLVREATPDLLDRYLTMIRMKTAELIRFAAWMGANSAGGDAACLNAMGEFGLNVGMAFQIIDDVLDVFGDVKKFGKEVGKDVKEHKMGNIVILLSVLEGRRELMDIIGKPEVGEGDVKRAIELMSSTNARSRALSMASQYMERGLKAMEGVPEGEGKENLIELAKFIVYREY
ncbi:polyprenyl synthetase [Thermocladium modestius]|uniref:Polyprenyl synthetase n=1 Tax=Thermocladium modestius TaxID=62609 RepID=A0A830GTY9_9CREN|nr:polyprenyl synthetase family protein [Thermocladium modestius]GGP20834.1 polyprenyl synthetase [Thermocladium modestius]